MRKKRVVENGQYLRFEEKVFLNVQRLTGRSVFPNQRASKLLAVSVKWYMFYAFFLFVFNMQQYKMADRTSVSK